MRVLHVAAGPTGTLTGYSIARSSTRPRYFPPIHDAELSTSSLGATFERTASPNPRWRIRNSSSPVCTWNEHGRNPSTSTGRRNGENELTTVSSAGEPSLRENSSVRTTPGTSPTAATVCTNSYPSQRWRLHHPPRAFSAERRVGGSAVSRSLVRSRTRHGPVSRTNCFFFNDTATT